MLLQPKTILLPNLFNTMAKKSVAVTYPKLDATAKIQSNAAVPNACITFLPNPCLKPWKRTWNANGVALRPSIRTFATDGADRREVRHSHGPVAQTS